MKEITEEQIKALEAQITTERDHISNDRMDMSFGEVLNMYKEEEIIIRPEYQRLYRWNETQKTAFIESILLGIPIPPIFVAENKDGTWELVDGMQRITTIISFFGELRSDVSNLTQEIYEENEYQGEIKTLNKWVLQAGSLLKNLEGFTIDTIPYKLKLNIKRATCRVEILRGESFEGMKYEVFKRLNSAGSKATPQEIRNAIYRGINPKLNELTSELSQNPIFQKLTALSEQKKRELYDQELVLKFIAFFSSIEDVNDNTERYLDSFMEKVIKQHDFDYRFHEEMFMKTLQLIDQLGDEKIFRTEKNLFVPSEYEGIMVSVARHFDLYENNLPLLKERIEALKKDKDFKRFSGTASNSKNRIKSRLTRANEIFSNLSNE